MALHTQRCYARFLSLRLPCLRVFALLTTRCVLRGVPLACVDQGSHCAFYYRVCFRFVSESCDQLPFYNLFLFQNLFAVPFLFQTGTIPCFTLAHLIIRLHHCLASGGWAGLSTTHRSFGSPTHPPLTKTTFV